MEQAIMEISIISKTLIIFDSLLAKISIPISVSKLNDTYEWYYLQNNKNQNIIGVLISMYYDSKEKPSNQLLTNETSFVGVKQLNNKNDISCDVLKTNNSNTNNLFLNIISRTNNVSVINNSVDNIKLNNNAQSQFIENNNKKRNEIDKKNVKLDATMIYNENLKSPDTSLANNLFSPFSCRFESDKMNLNLTNMNSKFNNNDVPTTNFLNFNSNNNYFSNQNNSNLNNNRFNNLLEISLNKVSNVMNIGEHISEENFFDYIENKLERYLSNFKETNYNNLDNSTINKSYNNYNLNLNKNDISKEEILDIFNKLKMKALYIREESDKVKKANQEILKQKESKYYFLKTSFVLFYLLAKIILSLKFSNHSITI